MKIVPAARSARRARFRPASFASSFGALLAAAFVASCGAGGEETDPDPNVVGPRLDPNGMPIPGNGGSAVGGTFVEQDCMGIACDLAGGAIAPPPGCGNGELTPDEACDDGNQASGDGCAADCLITEPGFSCPNPGQLCRQIARCGDGVVAATEQCDDGNDVAGDGCSARCRVELGSKCDGNPSVCVPEECGNNDVQGAEACDDGNTLPFDGCSSNCLKEPDCSSGSCRSDCGDGLVINEDCDDGNLIDGDGCSSTCTVEAGFVCTPVAACDLVGEQCALRVPAIFRDFAESHPDFGEDKTCQDLEVGAVALTLDANRHPVLNPANAAAACMSTPANFAEWFTNGANNVTQVGEVVLFENGNDGYVNRFGPLGEQFQGVQPNTEQGGGATLAACAATCQGQANNDFQCDNLCRPISDQAQQLQNGQLIQLTNQLNQLNNANPPDADAIAEVEADIEAVQAQIAAIQAQAANCQTTCVADRTAQAEACTATCKPCYANPTQFCRGGVSIGFDGNPLFFPVDNITGPTYSPGLARIPDQYGYNGFPAEDALFPGRANYNHNFYFTTEVQYWFKYDANTLATLNFLGDDDVWVFLNGRLAVDLGGIHVPSEGSVTINGAAGTVNARMQDLRGYPNPVAAPINRPGTTADFGLVPGNVYVISIFHAERKLNGSSFQLTLAGFEAQPSNCEADCGDGILSFGEECDDMVNDGGYGECGPDCKLGPFCGDREIQRDLGETCDDGPLGSATCRGCRTVILR